MRLNIYSDLRSLVNVFLNGEKEGDVIEAFVLGNNLEGNGYVIRSVRRNRKLVPDIEGEVDGSSLLPNQYIIDGLLCEKVEGNIRIEIADSQSVIDGGL